MLVLVVRLVALICLLVVVLLLMVAVVVVLLLLTDSFMIAFIYSAVLRPLADLLRFCGMRL